MDFSMKNPRGRHGGERMRLGGCLRAAAGGQGLTEQFIPRRDVRVVLRSWGRRKTGVYGRMGLVFLLGFLFESHLQRMLLLAGFQLRFRLGSDATGPSAEPCAPYQPRVVFGGSSMVTRKSNNRDTGLPERAIGKQSEGLFESGGLGVGGQVVDGMEKGECFLSCVLPFPMRSLTSGRRGQAKVCGKCHPDCNPGVLFLRPGLRECA
jgi:hypothetical protein